MLILRVGDRVYGTIVDKIDKVVGINSETVQPPHPIFGDINIKYISGVVEKQGDLYIILNVIRIFSIEEEKPKTPAPAPGAGILAAAQVEDKEAAAAAADSAINLIKENLPGLRSFYPSEVNDDWIRRRYVDWSATRSAEDLQLKDSSAAEEFVAPFFSPSTDHFWDAEYASMFKEMLPNQTSNNIQVWNIGCGKGYETYSFACILRSRYPDGHIKIWAHDKDIMAISQAPNMIFDLSEVPEFYHKFMTKGRSGYSFNQAIKDSIAFEYHDVMNDNPLPDLDFILARDILSFSQVPAQNKMVAIFSEKLKKHGTIFLGKNEMLSGSGWQNIGKDPISAFMRTE
jgi:purine-binding chemotaxis protein CheW